RLSHLLTSPNLSLRLKLMIYKCVLRPEAVPLSNMEATTVAETFFSGWVARFGTPLRVTTDQGRQFESELFARLTRLLGVERIRRIYVPRDVERFRQFPNRRVIEFD
ncbi:hypothetical protein, partial [Klebsiella pneumoniae]|uniref:hypothetical protein n=1 Tax=Klebsiella pneumoniae TaxID=573 RepID=UPI0040557AFA